MRRQHTTIQYNTIRQNPRTKPGGSCLPQALGQRANSLSCQPPCDNASLIHPCLRQDALADVYREQIRKIGISQSPRYTTKAPLPGPTGIAQC